MRRVFEAVARHQFVHFGAEVFVEVFDVLRQASVFLPPFLFFGFALPPVCRDFVLGFLVGVFPAVVQQQVAVGVVQHEAQAFAAAGQYRHQFQIVFVQFEYGAAFQLFGYLGLYIGVSGFEVGRGFAAAGGFGDVLGQFVKRACVRALRQGLVGPFGNDAVCRVETVGQHGWRVGKVLRVPEVDGVEGHGCAFLAFAGEVGGWRRLNRPDWCVLLYGELNINQYSVGSP